MADHKRAFWIVILLALLSACAGDETIRASADERFVRLTQEYLEGLFAFRPVFASRLGYHAYDDKLPDFSPRAVKKELIRIEEFSHRFATIPAGELSPGNLYDLETIRTSMENWSAWLKRSNAPFRRDPLFYNDLIVEGLELLLRRDFAPAAERMETLVARLTHIPYLLGVARDNLTEVPEDLRAASEDALIKSLYLLRDQMTRRILNQMNEQLPEQYEAAHIQAVYAYMDFLIYISCQLKRNVCDHPAVGHQHYIDLWRLEESIEVDVETTLELCDAQREVVLAQMHEVARLIDPEKSLDQILSGLQERHETAKGVRDQATKTAAELFDFVKSKNLFTLSEEEGPDLKILPPDPRTFQLVSFIPPSLVNTSCKTAFVSLNPEPPTCDTEAARIDVLKFFTSHAITLLTAGATYPGSFVLAWRTREIQSPVRQLLESATLRRGWAHYCEELVIDQGFDSRPEALLTALQFRLVEINRLETGCRVHCLEMPVDEAREFLRTHSFITDCMARREMIEIIRDPKAGAGFIGKTQILNLRDQYLAEDDRRTLKSFHDLLLSAGLGPVFVAAKKQFGKSI